MSRSDDLRQRTIELAKRLLAVGARPDPDHLAARAEYEELKAGEDAARIAAYHARRTSGALGLRNLSALAAHLRGRGISATVYGAELVANMIVDGRAQPVHVRWPIGSSDVRVQVFAPLGGMVAVSPARLDALNQDLGHALWTDDPAPGVVSFAPLGSDGTLAPEVFNLALELIVAALERDASALRGP